MTKAPSYIRSVDLHKNEGLTPRQIAERTGCSLQTAQKHLRLARKAGLLPPIGRRARGGRAAWAYYQVKGAAIPAGWVGDILDSLTHAEIEALLQMQGPDDTTLADVLARLVKDYFNARTR